MSFESFEESLKSRSDDNEEEDELVRLRMAALESMHNKVYKNKDHINNNKVNDISEQKRRTNCNNSNNNNNYYNRNASKRSNLIVLTANQTDFSPKKHFNSKSETLFTKLINKSNNESTELSSKHKRVLPGRFSRLEREDDSDEDSEEFSDSNEHLNYKSNDELCVFNKASDDESDHMTDNTTTDLISDTDQNIHKNEFNKETEKSTDNNAINYTNTVINNNNDNEVVINSNNENLSFASTSRKANSEGRKDGKDMIKLNITNNKISDLDILEKRKQKFGALAADEIVIDLDKDNNNCKSIESSNNHIINANNKLSVKNRLSTNSIPNEKRVYLKNCRHKSINNSKQSNISIKGIEKWCGYNTRLNRQLDSEQDFDDSDSHSTKKKLRSLVVMKTE